MMIFLEHLSRHLWELAVKQDSYLSTWNFLLLTLGADDKKTLTVIVVMNLRKSSE